MNPWKEPNLQCFLFFSPCSKPCRMSLHVSYLCLSQGYQDKKWTSYNFSSAPGAPSITTFQLKMFNISTSSSMTSGCCRKGCEFIERSKIKPEKKEAVERRHWNDRHSIKLVRGGMRFSLQWLLNLILLAMRLWRALHTFSQSLSN